MNPPIPHVPYRTEVGCAGRVRHSRFIPGINPQNHAPTHRRGATMHSGRPRPRGGRIAIPASARPLHLDAGSNIATRETPLGEAAFPGLFVAT
jgi:hypothetical protein